MPTLKVTWNSSNDAKTCRKCRALHGYSWAFRDEFPAVLEHPAYGVVYDLAMDESRAHGYSKHHCRCAVTTEVDDSDVYADLDQIEQQAEDITETVDSCANQIQAFLSLLEGYL